MIIVEGVDNTGKSTLIEMLSKRLNLYSVKVASRPESPDDILECWELLKGWDNDVAGHLISDRIQFISEHVYGPICRQTNLVPDDLFHDILWRASHHPVVVVWCNPRAVFIKHTFKDRSQMDGVEKQLDKIIARYEEVMQEVNLKLPVVHWDYTRHDFEFICKEIADKARIIP